jgi:arylsulfatase A-like enzyme
VIITGDHSYPAGEHGQYDSESGFYNEYFRTPLLIWGPGIKPGVNHDLHSQIDIAPTVLEMGGISTKTHFTGKSVFAGPSDWAPLVQPYAGTYFCALSGNYKYVYRNRGRQEFLFDLSKDPQEHNSIAETPETHALYESLRAKAANILENDRLVQEDRIWPSEPQRACSVSAATP